MNQPILEINNITKTFQKTEVVSPFSLQLDEGQIGVLVGGNGAGKSTIIKMIGGIFQPSSGEITVCGLNYRDRKNYPNKISYMPDDFHFPSGLTVKEWLNFYAKLSKVSEGQTDKALKLVGLHTKQGEMLSHLSKGMRQRLLFAQAYIRDNDLILLDEPTNGLDPYWVSSFADILLQLRSAKKTILLSTHQLDVAATIADVVIFLHQGKIYHEIEVNDVDRDHLHSRLYQINKEIYGFK
ncbi:ABC transporter ATP-binding protein [Neobacillus sp. LXY-4]|uniref:ABC transporter ATP-binding protein n=1 Tax=Neobacillus sp. LXY-4 TaxID=3379826 RepID=UPI003EE2B92B